MLPAWAFAIRPEQLSLPGYGRDTLCLNHLGSLLQAINEDNGCDTSKGEEVVAALHADGDGHCLVHAISSQEQKRRRKEEDDDDDDDDDVMMILPWRCQGDEGKKERSRQKR